MDKAEQIGSPVLRGDAEEALHILKSLHEERKLIDVVAAVLTSDGHTFVVCTSDPLRAAVLARAADALMLAASFEALGK